MKFDQTFVFGTATSSYQIEGAHNEGGRTPSIWDMFCDIPGRVYKQHNGDVACNHYYRYEEDIQHIKRLGVDSYRFSISWSRIFPQKGVYNPEGMAFYQNLVNELKKEQIKPAITLYHWDLPMWAHEEGGWVNRESVEWFVDYARVCFQELDVDVDSWITHNEPWCAGFLGYHQGVHAPGHTNLEEALKAIHHILLSHGRAVQLLKEELGSKTPIGITLNLSPVYAKTDSMNDQIARNNADGYSNRWFLDPVFKGAYPVDMMNLFAKYVHSYDFIQQGDLSIIATECDFLGINFYSRAFVEFNAANDFMYRGAHSDYQKTGMNWDISPLEFKDLIRRIRQDYTDLPIYITENGAAFDDQLENGRVHDHERVDYIEQHLQAVSDLNEEGMNVQGYFLWSLMDNFEWSFGYDKRFGILYVDFNSQERIWKDSAYRYAEIIQQRSLLSSDVKEKV
ncbi:GH1 family beta-glucosidase [Priestia koreensis]|uniref:GH1 family beta-glucosidase n=1 Tax=Priestia koreensis TaxID=284581 RepID=UPI001F5A263B|nr:GH1 family beta-glucosidase [Priestia koreensis]MCM3005963.1 GH1 family beta-glucosidase [Priestia koreensis]UNL85304.1 beta-glucosidase [Priestia koreensis]